MERVDCTPKSELRPTGGRRSLGRRLISWREANEVGPGVTA